MARCCLYLYVVYQNTGVDDSGQHKNKSILVWFSIWIRHSVINGTVFKKSFSYLRDTQICLNNSNVLNTCAVVDVTYPSNCMKNGVLYQLQVAEWTYRCLAMPSIVERSACEPVMTGAGWGTPSEGQPVTATSAHHSVLWPAPARSDPTPTPPARYNHSISRPSIALHNTPGTGHQPSIRRPTDVST